MEHALVDAQHTAFPVVNEDRVADGVKCISPLPLDFVDLFKEQHVLHGEAQQVGDIL